MGREVRMVPPDWEHPKRYDGTYQPMFDGSYHEDAEKWSRNCALWEAGQHPDQQSKPGSKYQFYWEWAGGPPDESYYMPEFPKDTRTHFQMYEDTSEGTPISPVMETPEALARWLADNNASAFGSMTATYDEWLAVIKRGWAPSAMLTVDESGGHMQSGVAAMANPTQED